ncbi:MAG TPA: DUF6519 domain-containing protein [Nannocystaceae bacterium]|nr:DUF6519 domain-containing protein [Nannocystaceae bacterium]
MNGDISRSTFDADKGYSSVREQQGRLRTDADHNEQVDIDLFDERTVRTDVIGDSGAPQGDAGMAITSTGPALHIGAGRYYVDGIRCENRPDSATFVDFTAQPFLPEAVLPSTAGVFVAYLDVWERPITAIQDPAIREVALGGADTTTRTQVIWQVKLLPIATPGASPSCASPFDEWSALLAGTDGTLDVRVTPAGTTTDPCVVPEEAGFRGVQNQLYRVQVHDIHPTDGPRFKWSRDNAAIVASVLAQPSADVVDVDRLGPGGAAGLELGTFVELTDDHDDLLERPGRLGRIVDIEERVRLVLDLDGAYTFHDDRHPQARGWSDAGVQPTGTTWIALEDGIEVRFAGTLRPGDAWIIPARTAILAGTLDRQIEWPHDGGGASIPQSPSAPIHHYAKIAVLGFDGTNWTVIDDCRPQFAPLVDEIAFGSRGGDGQHAPSGHFLPAPIVVGVSQGLLGLAGRTIRFSLVADAIAGLRGGLTATEPAADGTATTVTSIDVDTNSAGLAQVWWKLGAAPGAEAPPDLYQPSMAQLVEARLLDAGGSPQQLATRFVAIPVDDTVLVAAGGEGQSGRPGQVLPIALRARVTAGSRPVPDARVRFIVMDDHFNGAPLGEFTGGSIHASANLVTPEPWAGGSRLRAAVVATDAAGVAQVQWILGTETGLTTQRVTAALLDIAGTETAQSTLFTAQLAPATVMGTKITLASGNATVTERMHVSLGQLKSGIRITIADDLSFGVHARLRVEALLPVTWANNGVRPTGEPIDLHLPLVLHAMPDAHGHELVWQLQPVENETLGRVLHADETHGERPIVLGFRLEPIADNQGFSNLLWWSRDVLVVP